MRGFTEMRYWRRRHEPFDLEAELKAGRPEPSPDFVRRLEAEVRDSGRTRVGGVGYAASAGHDAAVSVKRVVTPGDVVKVLKRSAAIDQYGPKKKAKKKVKKAKKKGKGAKGKVRARTRPPFTG